MYSLLSSLTLLGCLRSIVASPIIPRSSSSSILPSSYVFPTFQQSRSNVNSYSLETFNELLARSDFPTGWVGQNGWTNYAQWDAQQGTRTFYNVFSANESEYASNPGGCYADYHVPLADCFNDDAGWAALASLQGYEAYGDEVLLTRAQSVFDFVSAHGFINNAALEAGNLKDTKSADVKLEPVCNGQSMYGGVYWTNGAPQDPGQSFASDNHDVNAVSTGLYALYGTKLCQITGNSTYCDMAYSALQWIDRVLVNAQGLPNDNIDGSTCDVTDWIFTYNAGLYIAAYATLGNLTSNSTAIGLAQRTAIASMTTGIWNNQQGVITEGQGNVTEGNDGIGFKAILIRYLHAAFPFFSQEVQEAITQYINIQYWALVSLDSNNPDIPVEYGRNWTGGFQVATGQSQVTALDVLNALILNPDSAFPS